eukprot:Colp12_sorted_trinity150504_noHs@1659
MPVTECKEAAFESFRQFFKKYTFKGRSWGKLGNGGSSEVCLGANKKTGEEVAVKVIDLQRYAKLAPITNIQREIKVLQELVIQDGTTRSSVHPNIMRLEDVYMDENYVLMVLERGGCTLFDVLMEKGHLPESQVIPIVRQIVDALHCLHSMGIMHADLKLENLLFKLKPTVHPHALDRAETGIELHDDEREEEELKDILVVDFGNAIKFLPDEPDSLVAKAQLNLDLPLASTVGTVGYRAPELHADQGYGAAIDMFALGVITYLLLYGRPPFVSDPSLLDPLCDGQAARPFWVYMNANTTHLRHSTCHGLFEFPGQPPLPVSAGARDFIARLLAPTPSKRPSAAAARAHRWLHEREHPPPLVRGEHRAHGFVQSQIERIRQLEQRHAAAPHFRVHVRSVTLPAPRTMPVRPASRIALPREA